MTMHIFSLDKKNSIGVLASEADERHGNHLPR